jgi:hypothetical protein
MYIFYVEGRGEFPFDMLRHDRAWPATTYDANSLAGTDNRIICLHSNISPDTRRWKSFGWEEIEAAKDN